MLIGVVGKPNVGKSTLFKALTLAEAYIANYPFATIKPNSGVGYVKVECADKFFNVKCKPRVGFCMDHKRYVPIEMLDVAGLVPGAHEGKGMGNQFLDDLNRADALIHVIDVAGTTNEEGKPVEGGKYDPAEDIIFLEKELDYWFLRILKNGWTKFAREIQQNHKEISREMAQQLSGLGVNEEMAEEIMKKLNLLPDKITQWTASDVFKLASEFRKKTKPMIIACNKIDVIGAEENFMRLKDQFPNYSLIACSAESELALKEAQKHGLINYIPGANDFEIPDASKLTEKQLKALNFIKENILKKYGSTGVQSVIDSAVFNLLNLIPAFPVANAKLQDQNGNILPDCFLVPKDSTALQFAYRVHTELGERFIRAIDIKTKMTVSKDHIIKSGDVIEIIADK